MNIGVAKVFQIGVKLKQCLMHGGSCTAKTQHYHHQLSPCLWVHIATSLMTHSAGNNLKLLWSNLRASHYLGLYIKKAEKSCEKLYGDSY